MRSRPAWVIFVVLLVGGCGAVAPRIVHKPTIPVSEAACVARGGQWTTLGLPYPGKPRVCDLKASDAGASCVDSASCEGVCLAPEGVPAGTRTTGRCSAYRINTGPLSTVEKGCAQTLDVE